MGSTLKKILFTFHRSLQPSFYRGCDLYPMINSMTQQFMNHAEEKTDVKVQLSGIEQTASLCLQKYIYKCRRQSTYILSS